MAEQTPKSPKLDTWIKKAKTLMEALPYIQRFNGKRIVVKYGGSAMTNAALKESFVRDVIMLQCVGIKPIIVHGGGPQIGNFLTKMGIESRFHRGVRITDTPTMDVVEMVLGGQINQEIVGRIQQHGGKAVGLAGKDGGFILAEKINPQSDEAGKGTIDLGHVGEVTAVNPELVLTVESGGFIPVIAPLGVSKEGESLNINADLVAAAVAVSLKAEKLILLTDVEGVLDRDKQLLSTLSSQNIQKLIAEGTITDGMIPKLECCVQAVEGGVPSAHIVDGRVQHAILLEMFTHHGVGTQISL